MVLVDLLTMAGAELCQGHFYRSDLLISPSQCQSKLFPQMYDFRCSSFHSLDYFLCWAVVVLWQHHVYYKMTDYQIQWKTASYSTTILTEQPHYNICMHNNLTAPTLTRISNTSINFYHSLPHLYHSDFIHSLFLRGPKCPQASVKTGGGIKHYYYIVQTY